MDEIDALHDELFDERPAKAGTRLERITALVFAALEEGKVRHQQLLRGEGKRAKHWIDVEVQRPQAGLVIIECKHWADNVEQDVMNSVASRRDQLKAIEAVVVSTEGFSSGAVDVATDEGIRLIKLSRLAEDEHWHGILREIRMRGRISAAEFVELQWKAVDPAEAEALASDEDSLWGALGEDPLQTGVETEDGAPAETVQEMLDRDSSPDEQGRYEHEVALDEVRYLRVGDRRIAVRALHWIEEVSVAHVEHVIGPRSPGVILVERVTEDGLEPQRVLMDHELRAWRITDDRKLELVSSGQATRRPDPGERT